MDAPKLFLTAQPMKAYGPFVLTLERTVQDLLGESKSPDVRATLVPLLNGRAYQELRNRIGLERRRRVGAFFTGSQLATKLITALPSRKHSDRFFLDPSCGAGDLLLAVASLLPVRQTLVQTLQLWGGQLAGIDPHPHFVRACRLRIALLAIFRGAKTASFRICDLDRLLPSIRIGNSLTEDDLFKRTDHVVMNPPFAYAVAPLNTEWATGTVTAAAIHFDRALCRIPAGATITAILPDVLRSGSRYDKWRQSVERTADLQVVTHYGLFDSNTDIDVFITHVKKTARPKKIASWIPKGRGVRVEDLFHVCVGPVVPYRDKRIGPERRYLQPKSLPTWTRVNRIGEKRRYAGPVIKPPFVVIRRTSRPGDSVRAIATIIGGSSPVAVENHLIVCIPRDRTIKSCWHLVRHLKSEAATRWLNRRIRCRHLTVRSIAECPLPPG